jgi:uncharacterized iron-regulated protein
MTKGLARSQASSTAAMPPAPGVSRRMAFTVLMAPVCVGLPVACTTPVPAPDRIVDGASGADRSRDALLQALRASDVVLLGELHDNPHHHQRRGALVAELGRGTVVVAEHLVRGAQVAPGADLRLRLEAAGFDSKAWGWPLFRPLFAPMLGAGLPVLGGNAPLALVRRVAREGPAAWPADLRQRIEAAPLSAGAQAALDRALLDGHCGHLSAARLPAMRAAQRVRDASMAQAVLDARAQGGRPVVLLAGNGHVRLDHGVAAMLRAADPTLHVASVVFGEPGWVVGDWPATALWLTPAARRDDPCAGLHMPAVPTAPRAAATATSAPRP